MLHVHAILRRCGIFACCWLQRKNVGIGEKRVIASALWCYSVIVGDALYNELIPFVEMIAIYSNIF